MMNIKSSLFYAALAACLGTGGVGGYIMSQRDIEHARAEMARTVNSVQCDDTSGKPKFERSMRPISPSREKF